MPEIRDLWDAVPVGPAPLAAITATRRPRPRRGVLAAVVAAVVVVGASLPLVLDDDSGGRTPTRPDAPAAVAPVAYHGELRSGSSCDALLAHYREQALALVGPYGWEGSGFLDAASLSRAANLRDEATSSETGTTVQEAGVDEPDVAKSDGRTLWRADGDVVTAYDLSGDPSGSSPRRLSRLDLGTLPGVDDLGEVELLLVGRTLVATSTGWTDDPYAADRVAGPTASQVLTLDVADPAHPRLAHVLRTDGGLLAVRQHGTTVRVVTTTALPDLDFVEPRGDRGGKRARAQNRALVAQTRIGDWLPRVSLDGGPARPVVDCDEVAVPAADLGPGTVTVLGLDAAAPAALGTPSAWSRAAVAADAEVAYASAGHLYLASVDWPERGGLQPRSHLYDFALSGTGAAYVGAGRVDGAVADRWSMDEHDDVLRVAVGRANANAVVTLRADDGALRPVGRVEGLGPRESITAVRWFDDLAVLVTFRETDPLYTVDLADPTAPRLLGALEIPGFSAYLHPVGDGRLLGVGQGPGAGGRWGAQVGLFATDDLTRPRRLDVVGLGRGTEALAGQDPRLFTWVPERRTALTVTARGSWRRSELAVLRVADGRLRREVVDMPSPPDRVRVVPLGDGRVVVSWRGGGRFLEL